MEPNPYQAPRIPPDGKLGTIRRLTIAVRRHWIALSALAVLTVVAWLTIGVVYTWMSIKYTA